MYNPTRSTHKRSKKRDPNRKHCLISPIQQTHLKKRILIKRQFSTNQNATISPRGGILNPSSPFSQRNQTILYQYDSNDSIHSNNTIVTHSTSQSPLKSIQDSLFSPSLNITHSINQSIYASQFIHHTKQQSPILTRLSRSITTSQRHTSLKRNSQSLNHLTSKTNRTTINHNTVNHISKRFVNDVPRMSWDTFDQWPSDESIQRPKSNEDIFKRLPDQYYLQKIRNYHHFKAKLTADYPDWYREPTLAPLLASTLGTIEFQLEDIGLILRELNKSHKFFNAHLRQQLHWCTIETDEELNDKRLDFALNKILENYHDPDDVANWLTLPCQKLETIATMLQRFYIYDKEPDELGQNLHDVTHTILRIRPSYTWKEKILMKLGWMDEPNYLDMYSRRTDKDLQILEHFQSALMKNVYLPQREEQLTRLAKKPKIRKGRHWFEEIAPYEPDHIDKQLYEAEHAYALSELKRVEDKLARSLHTTPDGLDKLETELKQKRRLEAPNDQIKRPKEPPKKKGKKKK